jgi:hypothetical protein
MVSAFFVVLLGLIGISLVAQANSAFPWDLKPQTSTMFGWVFLGAATLFAYIVMRPRWTYLATALTGFLAYDIVLFVPYVRALLDDDDSRLSIYRTASGATLDVDDRQLALYLIALTASAIGAIYLLFMNPATRVWRPDQRPRA